MCTHEQYINAVAGIAISRLSDAELAAFDGVKLVYGAGSGGLRGVTYYKRWRNGDDSEHPFVEVCAFGEDGWVQLAGTTIHELAHVLAGFEAGHGKGWKAAAAKLGLRRAIAAGQRYCLAYFDQPVRMAIAALSKPTDGQPAASFAAMGLNPRPCGAGIGTRGGKSRGKGSGSRLRKCACAACGYVARTTSKWIDDVGPPHCPAHGAMEVEEH